MKSRVSENFPLRLNEPAAARQANPTPKKSAETNLDDLGQGGDGDKVLGKLHLREVASVLVRLVDDVGQKTLAGNL